MNAPAIHLNALLHFMRAPAFDSAGAASVAAASVEKFGATLDMGRAAEILAAAPPL